LPAPLEEIRVTVRLHAELERLSPDRSGIIELTLPARSTVAELFRRFDLAGREAVIAAVNGELARKDSGLKDGDRVDLVTPMLGG